MSIKNLHVLLIAWSIHLFTALGVICGFQALLSTLDKDFNAAVLWLALALFIDGVDGNLARKYKVKEILPNVDGSILDNIIDYFTYVLVPCVMLLWFDFLPKGIDLYLVFGVLICSCYTFSNNNLKTSDFYFSGFPALWNMLVLYLHILETSEIANVIIVVFLLVLTFIPIKFVHPFRVQKYKKINLFLTFLWSLSTLVILFGEDYYKSAFYIWVLINFYFVAITFKRSFLHQA